MLILHSFVSDMYERIVREAVNLCEINYKRTLSAREVQTAVLLQLPGELKKHAISEGGKAVNKYHATLHDITDKKDEMPKKKKNRKSQSERAGVAFPVGRIARYIKEDCFSYRIGGGGPVYLAGVLEYLCAELVELSGNAVCCYL